MLTVNRLFGVLALTFSCGAQATDCGRLVARSAEQLRLALGGYRVNVEAFLKGGLASESEVRSALKRFILSQINTGARQSDVLAISVLGSTLPETVQRTLIRKAVEQATRELGASLDAPSRDAFDTYVNFAFPNETSTRVLGLVGAAFTTIGDIDAEWIFANQRLVHRLSDLARYPYSLRTCLQVSESSLSRNLGSELTGAAIEEASQYGLLFASRFAPVPR